jgi:predicted nucleotidyltransferase
MRIGVRRAAGATDQGSAHLCGAIDSPYVPRNAREQPIDLRPIEVLLARIEAKYHPEQVWLFGSRARGDAHVTSDWDLFVVVPDDTDERELDPMTAWRLQQGSGVAADVIPCRLSDFRNASDTVNTLSYVVASEGVLLRRR